MTQADIITLEEVTTPAQRSELAALAHIIWQQHYVPIIGQAQVDYMLARNYTERALADSQAAGARYTLARKDDRSVGFAAVAPPDNASPGHAWLDKLYVLQDVRNLGVGRRLVANAAAQADKLWGARQLALRVNRGNSGAIAVYQAMGFETEAEDVKDIGSGFVMDDYVMAAPLGRLQQQPAR